MARALAKVQKKVLKKKGDLSTLHENSRDAKRLRRAGARTEKLEKHKAARDRANRSHVERVSFFQEAAREVNRPLGVDEIQVLIKNYLDRNEAGFEELRSQRRPGRPPNAKEDIFKQEKDMEDREYNIGFWVPDVRNEQNLKQLEAWNGDWTSLGTIGFVRLGRDGVVKQSAFPPKGQS